MRSKLSMVGRTLMQFVPESKLFYRICKHYVDRCNGENNGDLHTNGELTFLKTVLPQCGTVFDVGANVGDWAALALSINPQLNLHCFEPSLATFQQLQRRNFPSNVICNNIGLGSAPAETTLFIFDDKAGINSLYQREGLEHLGLSSQRRQEVIRLDTVANYCRQRGIETIDFVKLDVEGHEFEVLQGMAEWLSEGRIKFLQIEYGGCNIDARVLLKDIWSLVDRFPYSFYKIHPRSLRRAERYQQSLENFQYQNWAIVKNGELRCA